MTHVTSSLVKGFDVFIHEDVMIKHPSYAKIGNHVAIDKGFYCTTKLSVGDYVHIAPYVVTIGGPDSAILLDSFSFVAAGTKLIAGSENYSDDALVGPTIPKKYRSIKISDIRFERFAGCGVNCSIMPGVVLQEGSVVGANSVVTKSTEPWTIYVGNPARPIKTRPHQKIIEYAKEIENV